MDWSLTDAALANKSLSGVPDERTDDELARRGFPSEFDYLLKQYRALQQSVQQSGSNPPKTTVMQDIMGLAALSRMRPPQGAQQPAPQAQPQPQPQQMPPQASAPQPMNQGIGALDAGAMQNPQFAHGGIITFNDGGDSDKEETPNPITYNSYMEALGQKVDQGQDESQDQSGLSLPTSFQGAMTNLQQGAAKHEKDIQARKQELKNRMIYQAKVDPSIEADRKRINAEKLANEHDLEPDRWQAMVDMGLAWAESAARGDDPLLAQVTGFKAGVTSLRKTDDEYKKAQAALDKELIALDHAKYVAEETNRKDAYNQVYKIQDSVNALDDHLDTLNRDLQVKAAGLYIQKQTADKSHVTEGTTAIDALTNQNIASGMDPTTARAEAVKYYIKQTRQFGPTTNAAVDIIESKQKELDTLRKSLTVQQIANPKNAEATQARIDQLIKEIDDLTSKLNSGSSSTPTPSTSGATVPQVNIVPGSIRQGPQ